LIAAAYGFLGKSTIDIMQILHVTSPKRIEDRHDFWLNYLPSGLKKSVGKPVRALSLVQGQSSDNTLNLFLYEPLA
jgi:hypothetical protein